MEAGAGPREREAEECRGDHAHLGTDPAPADAERDEEGDAEERDPAADQGEHARAQQLLE
jgi:hypothetical protein